MLFEGGFTFRNFVADAFAIFMFVLWFWLFVSVASDLFRRHDISGWAKVLWVIALLLFSYIGIFAYILTQGRGMAERNQARAQQARDDLRQIVGFSAADEIEKLDRLKSAGSISVQEYARAEGAAVQQLSFADVLSRRCSRRQQAGGLHAGRAWRPPPVLQEERESLATAVIAVG